MSIFILTLVHVRQTYGWLFVVVVLGRISGEKAPAQLTGSLRVIVVAQEARYIWEMCVRDVTCQNETEVCLVICQEQWSELFYWPRSAIYQRLAFLPEMLQHRLLDWKVWLPQYLAHWSFLLGIIVALRTPEALHSVRLELCGHQLLFFTAVSDQPITN